VCAVVASVETRGAVSPSALQADVAMPVAGIRKGKASITESAFFEVARRLPAFNGSSVSRILARQEDMWLVVICWVSFCRLRAFVSIPSCVAETKPVIAASASPVAVQTDIELASVTLGTVVVKVVLDIALCTTITFNFGNLMGHGYLGRHGDFALHHCFGGEICCREWSVERIGEVRY